MDAKSGVSGAGREAKADMIFSEVNESVRAYGVHGHRHVAEMEQELAWLSPAPGANGTLRASVSAQLGVREFMRLTLGAAELRLPAEELIAEAIEEYLDARGVESLGGEEFFKKLAAASSRDSS